MIKISLLHQADMISLVVMRRWMRSFAKQEVFVLMKGKNILLSFACFYWLTINFSFLISYNEYDEHQDLVKWFSNLCQQGRTNWSMIMLSYVGFCSSGLNSEMMLLKIWWQYTTKEWQIGGLSRHFMYHHIQTPKHLKSLWKSMTTSRFSWTPLISPQIPDAFHGNSYVCHHLYLLPYTYVLGFVACKITSKAKELGGQKSWSDFKQLKSEQVSCIGGSSLK